MPRSATITDIVNMWIADSFTHILSGGATRSGNDNSSLPLVRPAPLHGAEFANAIMAGCLSSPTTNIFVTNIFVTNIFVRDLGGGASGGSSSSLIACP
jgi:hypothetical protein